MKKLTALILAVAMILCLTACGNNEESPATTISETSTDETTATQTTETTVNETTYAETTTDIELSRKNGVYGNTLVLGNIEFTIPDGFLVTVINTNSYLLSSEDYACSFAVCANSIMELDEEKTKTYLPMQHKVYMTENATRFSEDTLDGFIAGYSVTFDFYGEITTELDVSTNIDATFTDSWYAYTVLFRCDTNSENLADYVSTFVTFTGYSKYIGNSPRFEFVQ